MKTPPSNTLTLDRRRTARRFRAMRLAPLALVIAFVWAGIAFSQFVGTIDEMRAPQSPRADGIVVVTGGSARIEVAMELLSAGAAERLLISGVHEDTDVSMLIERTSSDPDLFDCCVELDRAALDTVGNARETAAWARDNGFGSLLVVTSAYHMPRTLREIEAVLPGTQLVAFPIDPQAPDHHAGSADERTWPLSLMAREFVKLQLTNLRHLLG
ncbi:MAG: YdcF family protein [Devosiaceae bacterium]|nr:YdcF family protein [Devosiaceae bacterium MH13]